MKSAIIVLALALAACAAPPTRAQGAGAIRAAPAHKSALRDWKWWVGEAVIVTATGIDAQSSCRMWARGYVEANGPARGNNSCGETVGIIMGANIVYTTLHLLNHRYIVQTSDDSKLWRTLGRLEIPAIVAAIHGQAAAHNYGQAPLPRCPAGTACPAGE